MTVDPPSLPLGGAIQKALREKRISESLAKEIKARLSKPFGAAAVSTSTATTTTTTTTSGGGGGGGFGFGGGSSGSSGGGGGGGGFGFGGGGGGFGGGGGAKKDDKAATDTKDKEKIKEQQAKNAKVFVLAHEVLTLALADESTVKNLPETVGSLTTTLVSDCIGYINSQFSSVLLQFSSAPNPVSLSGSFLSSLSGGSSNLDLHTIVQLSTTTAVDADNSRVDQLGTLMAVAQCLFSLTFKYQATEQQVKELCALLQNLYIERMKLAQDVSETSPILKASALLTFMCTVSLSNMLNVWSGLIESTGTRQSTNNLLSKASVATDMKKWMEGCRSELSKNAPQQSGYYNHHVSSSSSNNSSGATLECGVAHYEALAAEEFLSIVLWSLACFIVKRDDSKANYEAGLELALRAIAGDKIEGGHKDEKDERIGGKAPKYFKLYLPANDAQQPSLRLAVPSWMFAVVGYELVNFTLFNMMPLVKKLADMDLDSYKAFSHVHDMPQILANVGGNDNNNRGMMMGIGYGGRHSSKSEGLKRSDIQYRPFTVRLAYLMNLLSACIPYLPAASILAPKPEEIPGEGGGEVNHSPEGLNDNTFGRSSIGVRQALSEDERERQTTLSVFVWSNMTYQLRQVFETHTHQSKWEPYTFKLCSAYFTLLESLCQTEQDAYRIFRELSDGLECSELLWSSTVKQCKEAVGLSPISNNVPVMLGGGNSTPGEIAQEVHQGLAQLGFTVKQLSSGYYKKHHLYFTTSIVRLLSKIGSLLGPRYHLNDLTADDAFELLCGPHTDQGVAGSILNYLASMVTNEASQQNMLRLLEKWQVLITTDRARSSSSYRGGGSSGSGADSQDLRGQFAEEKRIGRYTITIAILQLWFRLLQFPLGQYVNLAHWYLRFFAEEVMVGAQSRIYYSRREMWIIIALTSGILVRALDEGVWSGAAVPLTSIMASTRAPRDVLGELIEMLSNFAREINTSLSNERLIAIRVGLRLCTRAITLAIKPGGVESTFTLTARTVGNEDFLAVVLSLMLCENTPIRQLSIVLANCIGGHTLGRVAGIFQSTGDGGRSIIQECRAILDSAAASPYYDVPFPPELRELDDSDHFSANDLRKSVIELLVDNGNRSVPSVTSWLCGYPSSPSPISAGLIPNNCLEVVLRSINSAQFCEEYPEIAALYVKLLYVLKSNPATNNEGLRQLLKLRDAHEYANSIYQTSRNSTPDELDRYGHILRTLSLEIFNTVEVDYVEFHLKQMLVVPQEDEHSSSTAALRRMNMTAAVLGSEPLFAGWLATAFAVAPAMPRLTLPHSAGTSIYISHQSAQTKSRGDVTTRRGNEGSTTVLFNLAELIRLFRIERPHATTEEMRDLMVPFDQANKVLVAHNKIVNFVEGWCQVANVICGRVEDVSHDTLFLLLTRTLEAIRLTSNLASNLNQSCQIRALCAISGTAVSLLSALHECVAHRDAVHALPEIEAQNILKLLTHALTQYGQMSATLRHNVYSCFVVFLSFPNVKIDEMILLKTRDSLFDRITRDASDGSEDPTSQIMAIRTLQRFCSVGDVAESFISSSSSLSAGVGARLSSFLVSLLGSVDRAVCIGLGACTHQEASVAVFLPEAAFSLLSRLSMTQASALHQLNAFSQLKDMECWKVMRGALTGKGEYGGTGARGAHGAVKEVARRVIVVTLRWINVLARHLKDHQDACYQLGDLVNTQLALFDFVLDAPVVIRSSNTSGGSSSGSGLNLAQSVASGVSPTDSSGGYISTTHLDLLLQGATLLHTMSASPTLVGHMPELTRLFSLQRLLQVLSHRETRGCRLFVADNTQLRGAANTMGVASGAQKVTLAKICQLLILFFTNSFVHEHGLGQERVGHNVDIPIDDSIRFLTILMSSFEHLLGGADDSSPAVRLAYSGAAETCALLIEAQILALERRGNAGHYKLREVFNESTKSVLLRALDDHKVCIERREAVSSQQQGGQTGAAHDQGLLITSSSGSGNDQQGPDQPAGGETGSAPPPAPSTMLNNGLNTSSSNQHNSNWIHAGGEGDDAVNDPNYTAAANNTKKMSAVPTGTTGAALIPVASANPQTGSSSKRVAQNSAVFTQLRRLLS